MGFFDRFKKFKRGEIKKEEAKTKFLKSKSEEVKIKEEVIPAVEKEKSAKKIKKEETGEAYRILIKPLITEKGANLSSENKYVFEVAPEANKIEIKKAIKNVYGIEPININIINIPGKEVRFGRTKGRTKDRKKAIVTLKKGEKIEVYEGV